MAVTSSRFVTAGVTPLSGGPLGGGRGSSAGAIAADRPPRLRFHRRIREGDPNAERPVAGRFQLWVDPRSAASQRLLILRALLGLESTVPVAEVRPGGDGALLLDGPAVAGPRGGFRRVGEAYLATDADYDGEVVVPLLWDTRRRRILSNDLTSIEIDLATQFGRFVTDDRDLYPRRARYKISDLEVWVQRAIVAGGVEARSVSSARPALLEAFEQLDARLQRRRFLLGDEITLADVRVFATLVEFERELNADRRLLGGFDRYASLWSYLRDLATLEPFAASLRASLAGRPDRVAAWTAGVSPGELGERGVRAA